MDIGTKNDTYTLTSFNDTAAFASSVGYNRTDNAANPATNKATVVKKPKTACARFRAECMVGDFFVSLMQLTVL